MPKVPGNFSIFE